MNAFGTLESHHNEQLLTFHLILLLMKVTLGLFIMDI